ncbi:transketolase family protein [Enterococcus raffinosus]|uniref:Transketolase C-terminal domain-containing protein n=1 Tax=Enterococcus raffinosus TaxID=71452 RepID=A0AAW8T6J4_9ENTE|nr:transketolase C-terminal domain-containing protein [Enterococcus raffinosus]MDT2522309.1 transketolase C-terminal domain-containing protein [Enterococcus raffinosus]MDT2530881.1 transketolase C-terminal domain-containing protein [Enterococcus raffinosus]MDT2533496.1 transketolase C-terminal domain-containing protein [Enterococcus raffinosus]MDT2543386.1 transketolase C-terminal domain-containing protein [Enterococcus raffinosus]MDT2554150.1 transketolase C-terminal domain-containing protein
MFTLAENHEVGKELRTTVVDALKAAMSVDEKIIALDADLGGASKWTELAQSTPERFINVGIAEANMVGVAAGLSLTGYTPFIHTFGPFATRRVLDQIYLSGAYADNTINIYGSDPGFTAGHNGGTHTTWEDVALLRSIPEVIICDAADEVQMDWIIKEFARLKGVHYVRGNRKGVKNIYAPGSTFKLGKANVLREGQDYLIVATGQLVSEALEVANALEAKGESVEVIDMFTIKPLDKELLLERFIGKKVVITIENHSITGGLGSAVAEVLADNGLAIPLKRVGVDERFGQVGTPAFLQEEFGLTTTKIVEQLNSL